jgi:hypothetical protein
LVAWGSGYRPGHPEQASRSEALSKDLIEVVGLGSLEFLESPEALSDQVAAEDSATQRILSTPRTVR